MGQSEGLEQTVLGYRQARALAASAAYVEDDALHRALDEAQRRGVGVRETAKLLEVPRSTVSRWLTRQSIAGPGPSVADHPWLTEEDTVLASNHAWRHDPAEQISEAPFRIEVEEGRRVARLRPPRPVATSAPGQNRSSNTGSVQRARTCRFGRHVWDGRTNPENGAGYEVCLRCDAYRDHGLAAADGTGRSAAIQANIGGFGGGF